MNQTRTKKRVGRWLDLPFELLDSPYQKIVDQIPRFSDTKPNQRTSKIGARFSVAPDFGSGQIYLVVPSRSLLIMFGEFSLAKSRLFYANDPDMVKVRVVLSGGLTSERSNIQIERVGAFVEAFPKGSESAFTIKGGEQTRLVTVAFRSTFLSEALGIDPQDLPRPLGAVFAQKKAEPAGGAFPIGPEVMRAANDVLRASSYIPGHLLLPFWETKAREIGIEIIRSLDNHDPAGTSRVDYSVRDIGRVHEARDILIERYQTPPNIPELARIVGVNQTKLKSAFKATFGLTLNNFVQQCRMEKAVDLLAFSGLSVAETAYAVGYDYPTNFSNAFKRYYGMAPRDYLKPQGGGALNPRD